MDTLVRHLRETQTLAKLVGESPALLKTIELLPSIAASDATVLIIGETGAGKELVARALHYLSNRASFPFVPVNCGALSDMLFEDELFGHERGAFTGAHLRRVGLIAHAERGTLFLDEVDTLTLKAQIDLLRVLQDKTFRLVGSSIAQQANVRIVAATNAPIGQLVASLGTFERTFITDSVCFRSNCFLFATANRIFAGWLITFLRSTLRLAKRHQN